jgi:hypothetical protein
VPSGNGAYIVSTLASKGFQLMNILVGVRGGVRTRAPLLLLLLLLSTVSCFLSQTHALKLVFLPFMGGNSPSMDLMGVAAALQAR